MGALALLLLVDTTRILEKGRRSRPLRSTCLEVKRADLFHSVFGIVRLGMEVIHTTDSPLKQVALGERIAGMWDDFNGRDEKVSLARHCPSPKSCRPTSGLYSCRYYIFGEKRISTESLFVLLVSPCAVSLLSETPPHCSFCRELFASPPPLPAPPTPR